MANRSLSTESAAQINVYHLKQICIGMTQEEVFQIMNYPQIDEQVVHEQICYDVWFYVTRTTVLGQSELVPRNLTPLIFKEGILVAKGYDYYNRLFEEDAEPSGGRKPSRDLEDIQIEKALRGRQKPQQLPQEQNVPPGQQPMQKQTPPPQEKQPEQPPGAPLQPLPAKPQQPPPPAQPKTPNRQSAMCSRPSSSPSDKKSDPVKNPAPPETESGDETQEKDFDWNEKDQRMIEQGDEQNFDYW